MLKRSSILTVIAALALPAAASAATTVSHDGSKTSIAGDAEADVVRVEFTYISTPAIGGQGVRVTNEAGVTPGAGCVPEGPSSVTCPAGEGDVDAKLGDGADRFQFADSEVSAGETRVEGQGGSDTLTGFYRGALDGGEGDDTLLPLGYGAQQVTGGGGTDTVQLMEYGGSVLIGFGGQSEYGTGVAGDVERILGSSGEDYFAIGPDAAGGRVIDGGGGYDFLSYASADGPVKVAATGSGTDQVSDVESITGSTGDDELTGDGDRNVLNGGGGNDRLVAGDGSDRLFGGDGNDVLDAGPGDDGLSGGEGNDRLEAGAGEDALAGGTGGDVLRGGADKDSVSYFTSDEYAYDEYYYEDYGATYQSSDEDGSTTKPPPGVSITLDDRANDGTTSEGDDVGADIEELSGTMGDDTITGGPGAEEIAGYGGKDRIDGGAGDDKLHAGAGDDVATGGPGKDEVRGGGDNDQLDGGPGADDLVIGQDASDSVDGVDLIELRDGERDAASCEAGLSRVLADQHDIVDQKCALVERFTLGPPGTPPPPPVGPSPLLRVHLKGTVVDRRGIARVRVTCAPAPVPCAGRLSLYTLRKRKLTRMGGTVFAVPAAKTRIVRVKLNKAARRMVKRRRSVRTQVFVAHQDPKAKPIRVATLALRRAGR